MSCQETTCCPLCSSPGSIYHRDRRRTYFQCSRCSLVFVHPGAFLSIEEEKAEYELHRNSPDDSGYRKFLSRMSIPMIERLSTGSRGLDFGCGPGPTLSLMFEEEGFPMAVFDPLFAADESVLNVEYDFVTSTEVVEHFRRPDQDLARMWRCVTPGGYLGIMTKLVAGPGAFAAWHYKNDDTHICFFSRDTFTWLAMQWHTKPVFVGNDVVILRKAVG